MSRAEFSDWALEICLSGLVIFLGFTIWSLGKESKADKFGMVALSLVLGLGVFGLIFKNALIEYLMVSKQAEPHEKVV